MVATSHHEGLPPAKIAPSSDGLTAGTSPQTDSVADTKTEDDLAMERIEREAHAHRHDWYEVIIGKFSTEPKTKTVRPCHGCHGYSNTRDSVIWAFC
jgi:hypothetical protein